MNLKRKTKFFLYNKFPKMDAIHWMALPVRRELFQKWLWSIIVETDIMSHRHNANDIYKYDLMTRTSTSPPVIPSPADETKTVNYNGNEPVLAPSIVNKKDFLND